MRLSMRLYQEKGIEKVMSKKQNTVTSFSENTKKTIIIAAICAVAVVILAIALAIILQPSTSETVTYEDSNNGTSSATIKNGSFFYYASEKEAYPKTAQNWNVYSFKSTSSSGTDLEKLATQWMCSYCGTVNDSTGVSTQTCSDCGKSKSATTTTDLYTPNDKALYGIVSLDDDTWTKSVASNLGSLSVTKPSVRDTDYPTAFMLAAKTACNVAVISESSFSVASNSYVKITMWLNAQQLKDDDVAHVVFQTAGTTSIDDDDMYIQYDVAKSTDATDGWQQQDFYIFNKHSSSKTVKLSIGIGNVYDNTTATEGSVLFIDEITYETVSSNNYRELYANTETVHVFEAAENKKDTTEYGHAIKDATKTLTIAEYNESDYAKVDDKSYSPFITGSTDGKFDEKFDNIYVLTSNGVPAVGGVYMTKEDNVIVAHNNDYKSDKVHISFWLRLIADNKVTTANVIVEKLENDGTTWTKLDDACLTGIEAVEDITTADANCGWNQYHIYLEPSELVTSDTVRIRFFIGEEDSHDEGVNIQGKLFVSNIAYDTVTTSTYNSASSGTYVAKYSFTGNTASTGVTNGSFTDEANVKNVPNSWTHVFAGSNDIYKDGVNGTPDTLDVTATAVEGSGLVKHDTTGAPTHDDTAKNYLKVKNVNATSHGYLSSAISLSAKNVYAISVLVKGNPYVYLIDNSKDSREAMVVASIESTATSVDGVDAIFAQPTDQNGWTRYYFVVVVGNDSMSLRVALFNGKLDGTTATGEVCYDSVTLTTLGSYSVATNEDDDTLPKTLTYTANTGYGKLDLVVDEATDKVSLTIDGIDGKDNVNTTVVPTEDDWKEIRKADEKTDDTDDDEDDDDTTTNSGEVDLALLFSVISSVLLVAALAVVVVIRIFKRKNA